MRVASLLVFLPVLAHAESADEAQPRSVVTEPAPAPTPEPAAAPAPISAPLRAVRAPSAPKIDGDLSDAAWSAAAVFDGFVLNEPTEGGPGSERTELRVLYDERNLYVSFRCFDSAPAEINASLARRDTE